MKKVQLAGRLIAIAALILFGVLPFIGKYQITELSIQKTTGKIGDDIKNYVLPELGKLKGQEYNTFSMISALNKSLETINTQIDAAREANGGNGPWGIKKGLFSYSYQEFMFWTIKHAQTGFIHQNLSLFFWLIFGLGTLGLLMHIIPLFWDGPPGIKHNNIYHDPATSLGWIGILAGVYFIVFYILIYFMPYLFTESISLTDNVARMLGKPFADRWFMYGFLYTIAVSVMGIRMFAKYRHNRYHLIRTASVIFFQLGFAFLLPLLLYSLSLPELDLKNIWPLDYSMFYDYRLDGYKAAGALGILMLIFGVANIFITVPLMTYFYGKRWYCSWVCGCGGLAETLGDPYRQLSDKSLKSWKIERYLIHGVLVFVVLMTAFVLVYYTTGAMYGPSSTIRNIYGLTISSFFAGVVGTGFYPLMGNRVWCRFGCPLSAIFGIIQRFKSRFRITTNGGQCISCGNCSTYCEQGIDVRWYAQRGQNIVRASCVGCGVCSAVCPRGVLRLENGPEEGRINDEPILIGKKDVTLKI